MNLRRLLRGVGYRLVRVSELRLSTSRRDLKGDRDVEHSWVAANMPPSPGRVLDFGCGASPLGLVGAMKGGEVTGLDLQRVSVPYQAPNLSFRQGDILDLDLGDPPFDLIINCSSIEHVGLAGRYGSKDSPDGDLVAMQRLRSLLARPEGTMLLTVPIGRDSVFPPLHRVYGKHRLQELLEGLEVTTKEFWSKKDRSNAWARVSEEEALDVQPSRSFYALGLFVLRPGSTRGTVEES